jgi:hypothetical protein
MPKLNFTTDGQGIPFIGLDLDKDGVIDTLGVIMVDANGNPLPVPVFSLSGMGEVQEIPTQYTVLARLKAIQDSVTSITDGVKLASSVVANETNKVITANADMLATAFTATRTSMSTFLLSASAAGLLSLVVNGVEANLNDAAALDPGKWYAFEIPMVTGATYNLQYSANATIQLTWVVK